MKNILLFFLSIICFGQESIKAEYYLKIKFNENEIPKNIPQEVSDEIKSFNKNNEGLHYKYEFTKNLSKFELIYKINNSQSQHKLIIEQLKNQDKFPLYKDLNNKIFYKTFVVSNKNFNIKDSLENFNWKLDNSSNNDMKILNYNVKKAIGYFYNNGKEEFVEAWYSEDLKIPDGPDKYHGLPGLILKIIYSNDQIEMDYEVISLEYDNNLDVNLPNKKFITMEMFLNNLKTFSQKKKEINSLDKD